MDPNQTCCSSQSAQKQIGDVKLLHQSLKISSCVPCVLYTFSIMKSMIIAEKFVRICAAYMSACVFASAAEHLTVLEMQDFALQSCSFMMGRVQKVTENENNDHKRETFAISDANDTYSSCPYLQTTVDLTSNNTTVTLKDTTEKNFLNSSRRSIRYSSLDDTRKGKSHCFPMACVVDWQIQGEACLKQVYINNHSEIICPWIPMIMLAPGSQACFGQRDLHIASNSIVSAAIELFLPENDWSFDIQSRVFIAVGHNEPNGSMSIILNSTFDINSAGIIASSPNILNFHVNAKSPPASKYSIAVCIIADRFSTSSPIGVNTVAVALLDESYPVESAKPVQVHRYVEDATASKATTKSFPAETISELVLPPERLNRDTANAPPSPYGDDLVKASAEKGEINIASTKNARNCSKVPTLVLTSTVNNQHVAEKDDHRNRISFEDAVYNSVLQIAMTVYIIVGVLFGTVFLGACFYFGKRWIKNRKSNHLLESTNTTASKERESLERSVSFCHTYSSEDQPHHTANTSSLTESISWTSICSRRESLSKNNLLLDVANFDIAHGNEVESQKKTQQLKNESQQSPLLSSFSINSSRDIYETPVINHTVLSKQHESLHHNSEKDGKCTLHTTIQNLAFVDETDSNDNGVIDNEMFSTKHYLIKEPSIGPVQSAITLKTCENTYEEINYENEQNQTTAHCVSPQSLSTSIISCDPQNARKRESNFTNWGSTTNIPIAHRDLQNSFSTTTRSHRAYVQPINVDISASEAVDVDDTTMISETSLAKFKHDRNTMLTICQAQETANTNALVSGHIIGAIREAHNDDSATTVRTPKYPVFSRSLSKTRSTFCSTPAGQSYLKSSPHEAKLKGPQRTTRYSSCSNATSLREVKSKSFSLATQSWLHPPLPPPRPSLDAKPVSNSIHSDNGCTTGKSQKLAILESSQERNASLSKKMT